jgi:hypothetical protein
VTSITASAPLTGGTITTSGSIGLDETANYSWSGAHTFTTTLSGNNVLTLSPTYAASTSAIMGTVAPYSAGSATTNFPSIFWQWGSPTAVTSFSTSGTLYGANAPTGFNGNWFDLYVNGSQKFKVTAGGNISGAQIANTSSNDTLTFASTGSVWTVSTAASFVTTFNNSAATPTGGIVFYQANSAQVGGVSVGGIHIYKVGSALDSTGTNVTIAPVNAVTHVTNAGSVQTITAPTNCTTSGQACQITLIPDGTFTTTTGGNIAIASTAVVSKALIMTYDPATTKWYPSY